MDQKEWADDAITGLDVGDTGGDVSRRSSKTKRTAAASNGTSRKRPRSKPASTEQKKRPQKPKPPPAPPASLVSLMKKDKSVLHFFTSLQENVTYDVDKWKHEAAHWKRMASSLPSSTSKHNVNRTKRTMPTKKVQRKSNNKDEKKQGSSSHYLGGINNNEEEGSTIPITDEALFGECSDDEEDNIDSTFSNVHENDCCERVIINRTSAVEESKRDAQTLKTHAASLSKRQTVP